MAFLLPVEAPRCDASSADAAREWCSLAYGEVWTPEAADFLGCGYDAATGACTGSIIAATSYFATSSEVAFALCAVRSVERDVAISSHPAATLQCLSRVAGDFSWRNNPPRTLFPPSDDTLSLPLLARIGGKLDIKKNGAGLEVLSLPSLQWVGSNTVFKDNAALRGVQVNYAAPPAFGGAVTVASTDDATFCRSASRTLEAAVRASGQKFRSNNKLDKNC